jgi:hypothetical protein
MSFSKLVSGTADAPELALDNQQNRPTTPIAAELQNHFAGGGSAADGVRLVEMLEGGGLPLKTKPASRRRSTELPDDWVPSEADLQYARSEGLSDELIEREAEKFRDYWPNAPAGRHTKRDWAATWRNWIRRAADELKLSQHNRGNIYATHRRGGGFAINSIMLNRGDANESSGRS